MPKLAKCNVSITGDMAFSEWKRLFYKCTRKREGSLAVYIFLFVLLEIEKNC
jgi:hypothetical protein